MKIGQYTYFDSLYGNKVFLSTACQEENIWIKDFSWEAVEFTLVQNLVPH